jgi:hypothetical protein
VPDVSFKNYESLYESEQYDKAFVQLEKMRETMDKSVFHYNMGLVSQKLGKLSVSRYHFEKALISGLSNDDIRENLNLIRKELRVETLEKKDSLNDYFYSSKYIFNSQYVLAVGLILVLVILFFSKRIKKYLSVILIITIFASILSIFALTHNKAQIVLTEEKNIYEGPSKIFEVVQKAPSGMRVVIEKASEGWVKVIEPSRFSGWVENKGYKAL